MNGVFSTLLLAATVNAWWFSSKKEEDSPKEQEDPPYMRELQSLPDCLRLYMVHDKDPTFEDVPTREHSIMQAIWDKKRSGGSVNARARDQILLQMRKHIAELEEVGDFQDPEPHSMLLYREKPEEWNNQNDAQYKKDYIRRSYGKFVILVMKTGSHPIQGPHGRCSYLVRIFVGSHDDRLGFLWGNEIDIRPVADLHRKEVMIPCGEIEHVLEHVRELIDSRLIVPQDFEFKEFLPITAGERMTALLTLFLILFALFCCCAGCCCRGVFHYIFCLFLCKKKEDKNEDEDDVKSEVKVITYPKFIKEKTHDTTSPRPVTTAAPAPGGSMNVTGIAPMVVEPMLAVEPLIAPPSDIEPLESMVEIKVEGHEAPGMPALSGTLTSSLLDTTTTATGATDSLMQTGNSVQAVDYSNQNGSASDTSSIEISIHQNEDSISAAVRSGSADLPDSTSSEVEVSCPENDSSISEAVRNASEC